MLISRKRHKIATYFQWKSNRKSYVVYRMASVLVTLNDLEGHSPVAGLFKCNSSNICAVFYQISTDSTSRGPSATAGLLVVLHAIVRLQFVLELFFRQQELCCFITFQIHSASWCVLGRFCSKNYKKVGALPSRPGFWHTLYICVQ